MKNYIAITLLSILISCGTSSTNHSNDSTSVKADSVKIDSIKTIHVITDTVK
jgi:hypothetical protein